MKTQCDQIHNYLKSGSRHYLDPGIQSGSRESLACRIGVRDLRAKGVTVYAEMIRVASGKRVARYSL